MKNILLPTDFSANARNAHYTALKVFRDEPCRFVLLNTFEPDLINVLGDQGERRLGMIYKSLEEESRMKMKELLAELSSQKAYSNYKFKAKCIPGDLISEVKKQIKKEGIDLIVMGTKGATGAERLFMGSHTVRMITHISNCPVLAVPQAYDFQHLKRAVLPTDFEHHYEPFMLKPLLELIGLWKAQLYVVYAAKDFGLNRTQESCKKLLEKQLKTQETVFAEAPLQTTVADAIRNYADISQMDLIALVRHKHSFLEALTKEKVVKRIAFDTHIPLFILPRKA
jgi:nucleotide-binding universal stress UspA family protein